MALQQLFVNKFIIIYTINNLLYCAFFQSLKNILKAIIIITRLLYGVYRQPIILFMITLLNCKIIKNFKN